MRVPLLVLLGRAAHKREGVRLPQQPLEQASAGHAPPAPEVASFLQAVAGHAPPAPEVASFRQARAAGRDSGSVGLSALLGCLGGGCAAAVVWLGLTCWKARQPDAAEASAKSSEAPEEQTHKEQTHKEQTQKGDSLPAGVPTLRDYDSLLRSLVQEGMQRILPMLSRGQAVRSIAETRASNFALKAKAFALSELNSAAGELCEALDAPEAMLLLDLDAAAAAHFPPCAVLLAGLTTPFLLQFMLIVHLTQLALVLAPFGALVSWATVEDLHAECSAIPAIHAWLWVQLILVWVLISARAATVLQIREGQRQLNQKSAEARDALLQRRAAAAAADDAVEGLTELRELFVSQAALVQQVLLVKDRLRSGRARHVIGAATFLWLIAMVWTLVLVACFALVPGQIEFRKPYDSSSRSENYCAAWATVLTARISCLVAVLVFTTNLATVCQWFSDMVVSSERFSSFVLRYAQSFDESLLGLPVAQLLAKAFVLRDSSDMAFTRLAVALHERSSLTSELKATEDKLEGLKRRLDEKEASIEGLKRSKDAQEAASGSDDLTDAARLEAWLRTWRQRGKEAVEAAHEQSTVQAEQLRTDDFDRVVQRIIEGTEQLRQSTKAHGASTGSSELSRQADNVGGLRGPQREAFFSSPRQSGPVFSGQQAGQRAGDSGPSLHSGALLPTARNYASGFPVGSLHEALEEAAESGLSPGVPGPSTQAAVLDETAPGSEPPRLPVEASSPQRSRSASSEDPGGTMQMSPGAEVDGQSPYPDFSPRAADTINWSPLDAAEAAAANARLSLNAAIAAVAADAEAASEAAVTVSYGGSPSAKARANARSPLPTRDGAEGE